MAYRSNLDDSGPLPRIGPPRAVLYLPGYDLPTEQRRVLMHCDRKGYDVVGIATGEKSWASAHAMYQLGEADIIVTVPRAGHTTAPGVEVAGGGRTMLRDTAAAERLRRIARLVDSGLSIDEVVRILRGR